MNANLWAPWRMQYIRSVDPDPEPSPTGSFLADYWQQPEQDREHLVLHRSDHCFILLNRYPYTNGHLLVAPREHAAELRDLSADTRHALMDWTDKACTLLQDTVNCQGINVGINLGRCAGAGVPGHLHVHILPRWSGDTNFMATVGKVRVIPQALEQSYQQLKGVWEKP